MKRYILSALLALAAFSFLNAQAVPYNVVFDLTSKDTLNHKAVIRWVKEISASDPTAKLEVVLYGKSLDMIVKDRSVVADAVQELATTKKVTFAVCAIAMKNNNIDKSQLLPGIEIVADGVFEIVSKQSKGWGYIKAVL